MAHRLRTPRHSPLDMADSKQSPATHPKGRKCERPGCITILSRYNDSDRCFIHCGPRPLDRTGTSRDQRESRRDMADLFG